jgi:hypothetical protein
MSHRSTVAAACSTSSTCQARSRDAAGSGRLVGSVGAGCRCIGAARWEAVSSGRRTLSTRSGSHCWRGSTGGPSSAWRHSDAVT